MDLNEILTIVTFIVTLVFGYISKKIPSVNNKLIPIQNLVIGVVVAIIEWIITKDFSTAIALSGLLAGGSYDIVHCLNKIRSEVDE